MLKVCSDFSAQVLRKSAMYGRCKKPPMIHQEMLDLAKELLFRRGRHLEKSIMYRNNSRFTWHCAGVDGLTSFISVEPYSRGKGLQDNGSAGGSGSSNGASNGGNNGGSNGGSNGPRKSYVDMTVEEKVKLCCKAWNTDKGCAKSSGKCRFKHWCTSIDDKKEKVCWSRDHNLKNHK